MLESLKIKLFSEEFQVSFPTIGQLIDIETAKYYLSNNTYDILLRSKTRSSNLVLDLIDSIAYFGTLVPKFHEKIMKGRKQDELNRAEVTELVAVYRNVFFPWFDGILRQIDVETNEAKKKLDAAYEKESSLQ